MKPRFLLDENVDLVVQRQLRRRNLAIEVLAVGDAGTPALQAPDQVILRWIEENNYILISWDKRTIPNHFVDHFENGGHVPGVLLIRRGTTIGQIVESLFLVWMVSEAEEYYDRLLYIP
jgi:predicted nuclease of predicted toxin-antitoxin system